MRKKNKKKAENEEQLDYRTLSDADFLRNIDKLKTQFYEDYMSAPIVTGMPVDTFISKTTLTEEPKETKRKRFSRK